ncbi:hypothetical protein DB32_002570 [Sandaracinus amylolyticus]|uniref:Uncharacterized protein n=1 Tax=Sandaracinus amylolyticus TaxID=927083 RepID=A0A0F6W299_9BACT|nr:hypothetical protein DB32_002570 [Sandaracinus amylolyticus]
MLASAIVGAEGGRIEGDGIVLEIPAGALEGATRITVSVEDAPSDERYALRSPLYRFEPSGLVFAEPVHVVLEAPAAAPGSVLLWSREGDETSFDFAGFVEDGVAAAAVRHFSYGAIADGSTCSDAPGACTGPTCEAGPAPDAECAGEESAGSCPDACAAGGGDCTGACAGDATCQGNVEPCRRLCVCDGTEPPRGMLCASDPTQSGDRPFDPSECPETNAQIGPVLANGLVERPTDGHEILGLRDGEACTGWALRSIDRHLCSCEYRGRTLCRRPWDDPGGTPSCSTTLDGLVPTDALEEFATRAYTQEEGACSGYYVVGSANSARVEGVLTACDATTTSVGNEWREEAGTTRACQLFGWPGAIPESVEIDRARCRLAEQDWARLQQRREDCGLPPRTLVPNDGHTVAILTTPGEDEITGLNGRTGGAQPYRARAVEEGTCPPPLTRTYGEDATRYRGAGPTHCHAEGDALEQLSVLRMREPGTPGAGDPRQGATGGRTTGSAELIVDRDPCAMSCAPRGVDRMRSIAGLEELIVRSPQGTRRYADGLPETGVPLD